MLDTVIIGSGIAGVTAAIYARRAGIRSFCLFEKAMTGGQVSYIDRIDNYPGIMPGSSGAALVQSLSEHLKQAAIEPVSESVEKIEPVDGGFELTTSSQSVCRTRSVICATGAMPRKLGLNAELSYIGKGVSYCAVCDGFFFRKKKVAVIGGGNSALEEALYLAGIVDTVYLVHRRGEFRAFESIVQQVKNCSNIHIIYDSVVANITGDPMLKELHLRNVSDNNTFSLAVDGMFVAIGYEPATGFLENVIDLDASGFIVTDSHMATSHHGIFACGDCIRKDLKQLITSAAEGAIASMSCWNFLKG